MTQTTTHQLDTRAIPIFAERIAQWQKVHGRHGLPWQGSRDPYRIWLAEIMLQQTQVSTVMGYYERFLQRFPDLNRSEEHTSELQSRGHLVCRLLLEKKK